MIRALALLLAFAAPAFAETATVRSGEHGDFTRLVILLPDQEDWTLGRTDTGYAFSAAGEVQPDYDLSRVWDLITRSRLADVRALPQTGALALDLACDCHIFPFENRPGVVVLDIKPGPPPPGSAFEAPAFAAAATVQPATPASGKRYDWLDTRDTDGRTASAAVPRLPLPLPLETGSVSLEPLRDELLEQIARGAADGIVDMELPGKPPEVPDVEHGDLPWSNIHIGEAGGLIVTDPDAFVAGGRPEGACVDPALLDLPSWGGGKSAEDLLAESRAGLYGEFDAPDVTAIRRSAQQLLYLGFGAEARQTALLAGSDAPEYMQYYRSIGLIIDGADDPNTPFADMLDCEGPASLWAALARDRLPPGPEVKRDAIVQAFVALPAHLRQHLGLRLAEKFLALNDTETARMIRDAMERAPDADKVAVALLDAKTDLTQDDPQAAQSHAEAAVALDGDGTDALITLVESHFRTLDPLGPETADALQSLQRETRGTDSGPAVDRAVVLALALSNQIDAAFDEAADRNEVLSDLWRVTEDRATDDEFLKRAVLPPEAAAPMVKPELGTAIAERLLSLGFPDAARSWLGPVFPEDSPERRRLAAEAAFLQGDARSTVGFLAGLDDTEAAALRGRALVQLDELGAAAQAFATAGDAAAAVRLGPWEGDWAGLDPALSEPWLDAAKIVTAESDGKSSGLLGRGSQAIEESAASRSAIEALLNSVASPPSE